MNFELCENWRQMGIHWLHEIRTFIFLYLDERVLDNRWQYVIIFCSVRYYLILTKPQQRYFTKSSHLYLPLSAKESFPLYHSNSTLGCDTVALPWERISGSTLIFTVKYLDWSIRRTSFGYGPLRMQCIFVLVDLRSWAEAIICGYDSPLRLDH